MELTFPGGSGIVDPSGQVLAEGDGERGLIVAECELQEARTMRVRVPVSKDERPELYAGWRAGSR